KQRLFHSTRIPRDSRGMESALSARVPDGLVILPETANLSPQFWKGGESLRARARGGKSELHKARCRATPPIPGSGNRESFLNPESAGIRAGSPANSSFEWFPPF